MSVQISVERIAPIIETELWPLLQEHREELTSNKALMRLAPDTARYAMAEEAGNLLALVAREGQGIVGYSVNFIGQHLHYSDLRYAHNDVLFLVKSHRVGTLGLRLIRETERAARALGAQMVTWHAKPGTTLEQLMPRMGYRVQDVMFSKEL